MKDVTNRIFIYSTYKSNKTPLKNRQVFQNEMDYWSNCLKLNPTYCVGKYKGQTEESLVLIGDNNLELIIQERVKINEQECYLVIYNDNAVELIENKGNRFKRNYLGKWEQIKDINIEKEENFSYIKGKYYIVK